MKQRCLFIAVFLIAAIGESAAQTPRVRPLNSVSSITPATPMFMDDVNGRPFNMIQLEDIEGSAFLKEEWNPGVVLFTNGKYVSGVTLRFNVYNHELNFLRKGQSLVFTDTVKEFSITHLDETGSKQLLFRSHYPAIDKNTVNSFYEVLSDGDFQLLKYRQRSILEYQPYNQPKKKKFTDSEQLFLYTAADSLLRPLKKDKQLLLQLLPAQKAQIEAIIKAKKLRLKSEADWVTLFDTLNGE
jgi:hypothetical protein